MRVVYVLVSSEKDFYLEQAILSMHSLKKYNPLAEICLLTEKNTVDTFCDGRKRILKYIDHLYSIDIPSEFTSVQKSRFIKTSLRKWIEGDFMFIDTDTIICQDLSEVQTITSDISAVLDLHQPIHRSLSEKDIRCIAK